VIAYTTEDAVPTGLHPACGVSGPMAPAVADHVAAVALFGKAIKRFLQTILHRSAADHRRPPLLGKGPPIYASPMTRSARQGATTTLHIPSPEKRDGRQAADFRLHVTLRQTGRPPSDFPQYPRVSVR